MYTPHRSPENSRDQAGPFEESVKKKAYVETYGCQMNISDGELMEGILSDRGYRIVDSPEQADAWHAAGLAAGGEAIEDPPGARENGMYLAYLRDPDGNKLCALCPPG